MSAESGISPVLAFFGGVAATMLLNDLRPRTITVTSTDGNGAGVNEAKSSEAGGVVSADEPTPEAAAAAAAAARANTAAAKAAKPPAGGTASQPLKTPAAGAEKGYDKETAAVNKVQGAGGAERLFNSRVNPEQYPTLGDVGKPLTGKGIGINTDFSPVDQDAPGHPAPSAKSAAARSGGLPGEPAPTRVIGDSGWNTFSDAPHLNELRNASLDLRGDIAIPVTELPPGASESTIGPYRKTTTKRRVILDDAVPPPLMANYGQFFKE